MGSKVDGIGDENGSIVKGRFDPLPYALGKDSGLIDLLIVGAVKTNRLQNYVRITEGKIRRKLRVMVVGVEEFEGSRQTYLQRPHWKVV